MPVEEFTATPDGLGQALDDASSVVETPLIEITPPPVHAAYTIPVVGFTATAKGLGQVLADARVAFEPPLIEITPPLLHAA